VKVCDQRIRERMACKDDRFWTMIDDHVWTMKERVDDVEMKGHVTPHRTSTPQTSLFVLVETVREEDGPKVNTTEDDDENEGKIVNELSDETTFEAHLLVLPPSPHGEDREDCERDEGGAYCGLGDASKDDGAEEV